MPTASSVSVSTSALLQVPEIALINRSTVSALNEDTKKHALENLRFECAYASMYVYVRVRGVLV